MALDETRWRVGWMVLSLLLDLLDLQELLLESAPHKGTPLCTFVLFMRQLVA